MATKTKLYCVVYRTGGTENFKWKRIVPCHTREYANCLRNEIREIGYYAFVTDYRMSLEVGLPETYDESMPVDDGLTAAIREQQKADMGL